MIGAWIQTYTGRKFSYDMPSWRDVVIDDIAHGLSNLCRFSGQCSQFYSVAEHSYWVSKIVLPQYAMQGLLHDATEAYCADLPRPLKNLLPGYQDIERETWFAIAVAFDLPAELNGNVKLADNRMLLAERNALMRNTGDAWTGFDGLKTPDVPIECWPPEYAETRFLQRFEELRR